MDIEYTVSYDWDRTGTTPRLYRRTYHALYGTFYETVWQRPRKAVTHET